MGRCTVKKWKTGKRLRSRNICSATKLAVSHDLSIPRSGWVLKNRSSSFPSEITKLWYHAQRSAQRKSRPRQREFLLKRRFFVCPCPVVHHVSLSPWYEPLFIHRTSSQTHRESTEIEWKRIWEKEKGQRGALLQLRARLALISLSILFLLP